MADALLEHYQGALATGYDQLRSANPKWDFEERTLIHVLTGYRAQLRSVIDAPAGTGRFFEIYRRVLGDVPVLAIDKSTDMLGVAGGRVASASIEFREQDLVTTPLGVRADAVVCFRFLNLLPWAATARVMRHLFAAANHVVIVAIRTVGDDYDGEMLLDGKIHLHRRSAVDRLCSEMGFTAIHDLSCETGRAGDYRVVAYAPDRPLRESRFNKNQRLIMTYGRDTVDGKVYEVKDADHAGFIRTVTSEPSLRRYFPRIRGSRGAFVDAEWVPGQLSSAAEWNEPVALLARIQALDCTQPSSFDYVEDLVIPRFRKAGAMAGGPFCERVTAAIRAAAASFELRVSHPDMIPGNVIETPAGIVVIDNELMCRTRHHRIDVLNMLHNLPETSRAAVLAEWLHLTGETVAEWEARRPYLSNLWLARQVGSSLVMNQLERARACLEAFSRGESVLPYEASELTRFMRQPA